MRRVGTGARGLWCGPLLACLYLCSCSQTQWLHGATSIWKVSDPAGDVRLIHPQHPAIGSGTFDLSSFELLETETHIIAKAEFVSPVRLIRNIRLSEDRRASVYPQTVDIYVDSSPEVGDVKTLPDREVYVPANEAWDQVLVMS